MKATLRQICEAAPEASVEAEEIEISIDIPFVPVAGMMIAGPGGDYTKVDEVFWMADEPDLIEVWVIDSGPDLRPFSYWKKQGWRKSA